MGADVLDSDEDEIDEAGNQYLETLENRIHKHSNGTIETSIEDDSESDDSDDEDYDGYEETSLESYTTPLDEEENKIDEYQIFKEVMQQLESSQVDWYAKLVAPLSEQDKKSLQEVFLLANQRKKCQR